MQLVRHKKTHFFSWYGQLLSLFNLLHKFNIHCFFLCKKKHQWICVIVNHLDAYLAFRFVSHMGRRVLSKLTYSSIKENLMNVVLVQVLS